MLGYILIICSGNTGLNQNQQQTQQPQQSGGLFGLGNTANNSQQPQQNANTGSLFGGNNNNNSNPARPGNGSMFASTLPSGLSMGQSTSNQTVPGVKIDVSNLRPSTRFNDLHEELQKQIENIDLVLQRQMQQKNEVDSILPSHGAQLSNIPNDVDFITRKLAHVEVAHENDAQAIHQIDSLIKADAEDARLSFRTMDNLKLPAQFHNQGIWSTNGVGASSTSDIPDLVSYFSKQADDMARMLASYTKNITEIEQHLRGVEHNTMQQMRRLADEKYGGDGADEQVRELVAVLRQFENGIVTVAGSVGEIREEVQNLQIGGYAGDGGAGRRGDRLGIY